MRKKKGGFFACVRTVDRNVHQSDDQFVHLSIFFFGLKSTWRVLCVCCYKGRVAWRRRKRKKKTKKKYIEAPEDRNGIREYSIYLYRQERKKCSSAAELARLAMVGRRLQFGRDDRWADIIYRMLLWAFLLLSSCILCIRAGPGLSVLTPSSFDSVFRRLSYSSDSRDADLLAASGYSSSSVAAAQLDFSSTAVHTRRSGLMISGHCQWTTTRAVPSW